MDSIVTPKDNIILVPTDFSTSANFALEHSVEIAKLFDNEITLLYVVEENFLTNLFGNSIEKSVMLDTVNKKLIEKADELKAKHPGLIVNAMVREGKPYKMIVEAAETLACDSIVMGYSGSSSLEYFMGGTTNRVLKSSPVPVVVIKDTPAKVKYEKIVMPIDLSRESRQKVSWATHLAKKYNSEIHVIMEMQKDEFAVNKVKGSLLQVENMLAKEGVRHVTKILDDANYPDHFGKDILQYCEEVGADMVMIMTQQEKELKEYFLGSFARHIIENSRIPVMAIKPKELPINYWATESFA